MLPGYNKDMKQQFIMPAHMKMKKKMNLFIQTDSDDISSHLRQPTYLHQSQTHETQEIIQPLSFKRIQTEQRIQPQPADRDFQQSYTNNILDGLENQQCNFQSIERQRSISSINQNQSVARKMILNVEAIEQEYKLQKQHRNHEPVITKDYKLSLMTSPKNFLMNKSNNVSLDKKQNIQDKKSNITERSHGIPAIDSHREKDALKSSQPQGKKILQFKSISMAQLKKQLQQAKTIINSLKQPPVISTNNICKQKIYYNLHNLRNQSSEQNQGYRSYRYAEHVYEKYSNSIQNSRRNLLKSQLRDSNFNNSRNSKKYLTLKDSNIPFKNYNTGSNAKCVCNCHH